MNADGYARHKRVDSPLSTPPCTVWIPHTHTCPSTGLQQCMSSMFTFPLCSLPSLCTSASRSLHASCMCIVWAHHVGRGMHVARTRSACVHHMCALNTRLRAAAPHLILWAAESSPQESTRWLRLPYAPQVGRELRHLTPAAPGATAGQVVATVTAAAGAGVTCAGPLPWLPPARVSALPGHSPALLIPATVREG